MSGPAARRRRRPVLLLAVAAAALGADFATKEIALASFAPGESMQVVGELLQFTLVFNTGAAFSMGQDVPWLFFLIALGVVAYILFMARKLASTSWACALGLILGGAVGNLVDRAFRPPAPLHGAVVDWIQLPNYPVFNIADSCIVVGGALAVLLAFRGINIDGTRESDDKDAQATGEGSGKERGEAEGGAEPDEAPAQQGRGQAGAKATEHTGAAEGESRTADANTHARERDDSAGAVPPQPSANGQGGSGSSGDARSPAPGAAADERDGVGAPSEDGGQRT